jgi:hypothetical protein
MGHFDQMVLEADDENGADAARDPEQRRPADREGERRSDLRDVGHREAQQRREGGDRHEALESPKGQQTRRKLEADRRWLERVRREDEPYRGGRSEDASRRGHHVRVTAQISTRPRTQASA